MKTEPDTTVMISPEYRRFIEDLKARVINARISAARAVTHDAILLYWDIGRGIVEKQQLYGWGDSVVEMVAADLRRTFPRLRGFSPDSVWRMRQFYAEYADPSFLEQLVPEMKKRGALFLQQAVAEIPGKPVVLSHDQFLAQLVPELLAPVAWGHHVELLKKVKVPAARLWYLRATSRFGWSRNVLLNQIKAGAPPGNSALLFGGETEVSLVA